MRADIICFTEALVGITPTDGHTVASDPHYGYRAPAGRRKVLLWSREPWHDVDVVGPDALPGGRFVQASTGTPLGLMTVVGACVPWRDAHVRTGRRDRRPWEDHLAFLAELAPRIRALQSQPTILAGDFNQTVPRTRAPAAAVRALVLALEPLELVTAGPVPGLDRPVIDHVAVSRHFTALAVRGIPAVHDGVKLSDHPGLVVELSVRQPPA